MKNLAGALMAGMGLCMANIGGAGDVADLSAADCMELMPFAICATVPGSGSIETAPKKEGENDLSYIPITPETPAIKNRDPSVIYGLLPAIVRQAWDVLHQEEKKKAPKSLGASVPRGGESPASRKAKLGFLMVEG